MFNAYVRRLNGSTHPIHLPHAGQQMGLTGESSRVRSVRLFWEQEPADSVQEESRRLLLETVPLVDRLVLTRSDTAGERTVFHGLVTDTSSDGHVISLIAVDNPKADHLYEHPFSPEGELVPSDIEVSEPRPLEPGAEDRPQNAQRVEQVGMARVQAAGPASVRPLAAVGGQAPSITINDDPAARPGGLPGGGLLTGAQFRPVGRMAR